jgi:hypothetical protein
VRRFAVLSFCCGAWFALVTAQCWAQGVDKSGSRFLYKNSSGKTVSVPVIHHYWLRPVVHPPARIDPRLDPKLRRAATIAEERATARSKAQCWHFVKAALVAAGVIKSYPKTAYAADAGKELVRDYGFKRLHIHDPYAAPVGAVLVYGDRNRGHVELRTRDGFASDYRSKYRCFYPLVAVYGKFSS